MSDTRPPITAGPIHRAFKFLKSTSVSGGAVAAGVGVVTDDDAAVISGDEIGDGNASDELEEGFAVGRCPGSS
jgi:hypothetical protein